MQQLLGRSMTNFEYKAIVAPRRGKAAKGVRGGPEKFANAVSMLMNEMAGKGWEYLRADTLPNEERQGLTGRVVKYQSLLVFRRKVEDVASIDTLLAEAEAEKSLHEDAQDYAEPDDSLEADLQEELSLQETDDAEVDSDAHQTEPSPAETTR